MICVLPVTVKETAALVPNRTAVAPLKPVPDRVTVAPPEEGPWLGLTEDKVGAAMVVLLHASLGAKPHGGIDGLGELDGA